MRDFNVVAILDRSVGNAVVGDMWQETRVFSDDTPVRDIVKWAATRSENNPQADPETLRANLTITIAQ